MGNYSEYAPKLILDESDYIPLWDVLAGQTKVTPVSSLLSSAEKQTEIRALFPFVSLEGADPTGATDSSAAFAAAAAKLTTYGGTVVIPPGDYRAEGIPTSVNNGKPISWIGSGQEATKIRLPSTPTKNMFISETLAELRGGGVRYMTLRGDGSVEAPELPASYDAAYDCFDLTGITQIFQFTVAHCMVRNFRRGWQTETGNRNRSPIFHNNTWWYNYIAINIGEEHPILSGINEVRYNYIGLSGIIFDMQVIGMRINYNHYGVKPSAMSRSRFSVGTLFKNYKRGIVIPGTNSNIIEAMIIAPADTRPVSSITTSGNVITVTINGNHRMESGDTVVLYGTTGLTPDINEVQLSATVINDNTFTADTGAPISGSAADGRLCTNLCDIEANGQNNTIRYNQFVGDLNNSRNGLASIYFNYNYPTGNDVSKNTWSWHNDMDNGQRAIAFKGVEMRDCQLMDNGTVNVSQFIRSDAGSIEQSLIHGNRHNLDGGGGPGSGRDFYELSSSGFGNVVTDNLVRFASAAPVGRYVFNIDATRGVVASNYVRYPSSTWSGGINITGADAVTVGAANGTDHTTTLASNAVSSF